MEYEKLRVAVVDGQGGGIGRAVIELMKKAHPEVRLRALGTNSAATQAMLRAGADEGATGENAVVWNAARMDIIFGPIGIITANGLMGEITPRMAAAVSDSSALKLLVPSRRCRIRVAGSTDRSVQVLLRELLSLFEEEAAEL